ncbi:hypothetical protein ACUN0C_13020 [Faunimonas sp. B44]|uniref:hypothetical protein n=1 Tax=Faunimonas sp. B44 TaxID=3461493 RepID=UPI00404486A3
MTIAALGAYPGRFRHEDRAVFDVDAEAVLHDLKRTISHVELDCGCRAALDVALDRFMTAEPVKLREIYLRSARDCRRRIDQAVTLLAELEEIRADEPDASAFEELRQLFDDIVGAASEGAWAMRAAAASARAVRPLPAAALARIEVPDRFGDLA